MIPYKLVPFKDFVAGLQQAPVEDHMAMAEYNVRTPGHFEEMRQHLINYYDQVEAVHSFTDHNGQVWDCVPIDKQPAAKKTGGKIATPVRVPGHHQAFEHNRKVESIFSGNEFDAEGNEKHCPEGCIPLRRLTLTELSRFHSLQDYFRKTPTRNNGNFPVIELVDGVDPYRHLHANAYEQVNNIGGRSILNVWKPAIDSTQQQVFSLSQQWYVAGQGNGLQTLEGGWQVSPVHYRTNDPCLFIFWTATNYEGTGAYNGEDGNFFFTNRQWVPGQPLPASSVAGVVQVELDLAWCLIEGNWWLYINGIDAQHAVGYYPASLYNNGLMALGATSIDYGGEVCCMQSGPAMGSGAFPQQGNGRAAYQRNIYYFDGNQNPDAQLTPAEEAHDCYQITLGNNAAWGEYFFFGGPGGNNC